MSFFGPDERESSEVALIPQVGERRGVACPLANGDAARQTAPELHTSSRALISLHLLVYL